MNSTPIFIGGFFKSGTSLLRAMIGNHSCIASGLETQWFDICWDRTTEEKSAALDAYADRLAKFYDLPPEKVREMSGSSSSIHEFINAVLGAFAQREGKPRWAEKTPGNICHLPELFAGWPTSKVIHIIRDPKDIYASLRETQKWDTPEVFSSMWSGFLPCPDAARAAGILNEENYLEVRYEGLVNDSESHARQILDFLQEPWEEAVANFSGKSDDFDKVLEITGRESSTLERLKQPLVQNRVGIWRDLIPEAEIESIRRLVGEQGHGDVLSRIEEETQRLGY